MALPISIERLLDGSTVESSRIEFKKGWNPGPIYRSICAFANDFDNLGGGYIVVGVEEENGLPVRPVVGLPIEQIEPIEKEMITYNNLISPVYFPKTSIEDVDGKKVFVIWIPGGSERPYKVPDEVNAKEKKYNYYIRYNSSSIVPKGELERELLDLTNHVPFDDRPNHNATIADLSPALVMDYLRKTGSTLFGQFETKGFTGILQDMELLSGPKEALHPRNVALMMFNENPSKFFPYTQIDIVVFPKGRAKDPSNFIEVPSIKGPIDKMIRDTMDYLRTNILVQLVHKPGDKPESDRAWNYPYQALEEIVCNAVYHRNYREREPIEITIEPDSIRVISYGGPDRSLDMEELNAGHAHPRRYRNRRIGDFLKELDLTEGKATGIPTVIDEMTGNGSPMVEFTFDEERTWFMARIPVHPAFLTDTLTLKNSVSQSVSQGVSQSNSQPRTLSTKEKAVLKYCTEPRTSKEILEKIGVSYHSKNISRYITNLVADGFLRMTVPDNPKAKNQQYVKV